MITHLHCSTCHCDPSNNEAWVRLGNGRRISLGPADAVDAFLRKIVTEQNMRWIAPSARFEHGESG